MPNTDFHNADTKSADTMATFDSDVQTLPADPDTTATFDSNVVHATCGGMPY